VKTRRATVLVATLVALVALVGGGVPASARAGDMFGVSVNRVFNNDFEPSHWDKPLSQIRAAGIRSVRSDAFWEWAEPSRPSDGVHHYNWSMLDAEASAIARHDLQWLPVLGYSTFWASASGDRYVPPDDPADYAAFAGAYAARYGRGGSFWSEHPEIAPKPVTTYEIWNEPNVDWFWRPSPDPARYAELYAATRRAIRGVDPAAAVLIGGIVPDAGYLRGIYAASPDLRGNVDGLGVHPYAGTVEGVVRNVVRMRNALDALGERGVPIHITELGWPTAGRGWIEPITDAQRAQYLAIAADGLARSDCGIASVVPYTWTSAEHNLDDVEDWLGIRRPDGGETATSRAYEAVVARWDSHPQAPAERLRLCHPPAPSGDSDRDGNSNGGDSDDDGDRLSDAVERARGTSSYDRDSDDDGLADGAERRTHPARADTDGDGLLDGLERGVTKPVRNPPGPVVGTSRRRFQVDRDPRTRTRGIRKDSDRDGLDDDREDRNRNGRCERGETNPRSPDSDRDGIRDARDARPLTRG
jgi:hypothetical protein